MESLSFLEDIYPRHLLYAVTIRSPIAKGKLNGIVFPELPENYYAVTAKNIPGENRLENTSMPILADDRLNYIGEPVAILLGHDKTKLEEFASKCEIDADEEEPAFSCGDDDKETVIREITIGDPDKIFQHSGKIVTASYSTGIQAHWYAEPAGAVTWYESGNDNSIVVKTSTQWSYHVKRSVARVLGFDLSNVSVEPTPIALHMDGKLWFPSLISCHAALGTYITKKPVRLILNREEDFFFTPKRCKSDIDIISTIDDNGNITASEVEISVNLGAYMVNADEILDQVCLGSIGYYNTNNVKLTAKAGKTNIPPQGPFSGFGLSQGFFAMERHVSIIADMVNNDPAQWRKDNINQNILSNSAINNDNIGELINTATNISDYYRKWASYELLRQSNRGTAPERGENPRGIGIAIGFQGNDLLYNSEGKSNYEVEVTLTKKKELEIKTGICSSEDYIKLWEKSVQNIISVKPHMIRIVTENAPDSGPSCSSRNITAVTKAVEECIKEIQKRQNDNQLPITVRKLIKPQTGALLNGLLPPAAGKKMNTVSFSKPGMACAVVEVSIDIVECVPKIRGVWMGVDGGRIISFNRARRNLSRGAMQALGWAFTESIEYTDGILPAIQYDNFSIPFAADIPPIKIDFLSNDNETKGIGELPFTCIPAAFVQAVSQAMDHSFKSIPLKRKEIWEMIRLRNTQDKK